jgi:UDP-N-acetylmuramate--alanine ligase
MHIYFSGIGGTGIGPLALIARDAGYEVSGSDKRQSQYTDYLISKGINLHIGQSSEQIAQTNDASKIDWIVFSSAVFIENPDHPELVFAKENNIKCTKRDECLNQILHDKDLKLLAVSGTHGKTTTTALLIWLFKQLNEPVSYSVGAKISFGPMGNFDPSSKYFIYECDEFDRNFLSFEPETSVITAVDWDHHDIYPTRESYQQAFRDFINKSRSTYMFKKDSAYLSIEASEQIHVLDDNDADILKIRLIGLHNRQNAWVAIWAAAAITGHPVSELIPLAESFPGSSRRFEKINTNIYSDYAHTPEEITATMELAHEISDDVVVVYEPLTNRRQHYMKDLHNGVFETAKKVYWLPSYLGREDPNQPTLSPEDLIRYLSPKTNVATGQMGEELKDALKCHLANNDLVVCMAGGGGSSLDEWVRREFGATD